MALLQIIPLAVSVLLFFSLFIVRIRGNKRVYLALSLSILLLLSFCFIFFKYVHELLPESNRETVFVIIQALWWFSLAYVINALLKFGVYQRSLTSDGDSTIPKLVQHLITILIFMITTMIVLRFIFDQSITGLATASGAVAILLGYSSRIVLDELFSGLALFANEPFEKGDLIQLNDEWFYVVDVNWRAVTYMDMDHNHVEVPNTIVAASKIRNLDRPNKITRRTMFFIAEYNIPPRVIIDEAQAAMNECRHVMPHRWNFVSFYSFEKTGMQYKLHFHVSHYDDWYLASDELVNAMWYRFSRKGIRFAHQRNLNYKDPLDEKKGLYKSAYDEATLSGLIEQFSHIPIFDGMTDKDTESLLKSVPFYVMGPPEVITSAGVQRSSMFLIVSGMVDLYEVDLQGRETWMSEAGPNSHVGIMALLTGSPQRTTVRAREETVICEITSEALHGLFDMRPEVMEKVAESVTVWRQEENEALNTIAENRKRGAAQIKVDTRSLSKRIMKFFNLRDE